MALSFVILTSYAYLGYLNVNSNIGHRKFTLLLALILDEC